MSEIKLTRMELLRLRKHLKVAQHGHSLLKEKRDSLLGSFLAVIKRARDIRKDVGISLSEAFNSFTFSTAEFTEKELLQFFSMPSSVVELEQKTENIIGVRVPKFAFTQKGSSMCYSLIKSSTNLDKAVQAFHKVLGLMVELAEAEHSARLLSSEIEKTRRRVNALEYTIIPKIQGTIKFIVSKLDEQERRDKITRIKIKELITAEVARG